MTRWAFVGTKASVQEWCCIQNSLMFDGWEELELYTVTCVWFGWFVVQTTTLWDHIEVLHWVMGSISRTPSLRERNLKDQELLRSLTLHWYYSLNSRWAAWEVDLLLAWKHLRRLIQTIFFLALIFVRRLVSQYFWKAYKPPKVSLMQIRHWSTVSSPQVHKHLP